MEKKFEKSKIAPGALVLVSIELFLALWVMGRYQLDPAKQLGAAVFVAVPLFVAHALLPLRLRQTFLLLVTFGLLFHIVGPTKFALVTTIGLGLIGLCHLPLAFAWRVLAISTVACILAGVQLGWDYGGRHLPGAIPILGAIFMFRMILYLYVIRHEKPGSVTLIERITYFFLLPAPLFPFFPTLDYKTTLRCFYARPSFDIYQVGILWISRGIVHLVLYRVIYHFFSPPAEFVTDLGGVMTYCLSGYLIYLRVSGVFHIIAGILRLFGYDLPETHRLYFFASGFSDYWRRINIYWKDFMTKVFFYPTFIALRRSGLRQTGKVAIATMVVFLATTLLHAYQTFWLRGDYTIHETDYWFWGVLGVLVVMNNLFDERNNGMPPAATSTDWSFKAALVLSLRVVGMFVLLSILWALWSSQTLANFFGVMTQTVNANGTHLAILLGFCGIAITLGVAGLWAAHRGVHFFEERPQPVRSVATAVLPLLLLGGLWEYHDATGLTGEFGSKFDAIQIDQPNERDQIQKERSYYEVLMGSGGEAANFGVDEEVKAKDFDNRDIRGSLYKKSYGPVIAWGAKWSTNGWGMRDKDYDKEKPDGVYRIAVSGASYTAARGVGDGMGFESLVEEALNKDGKRFEILNFAFSNSGTLQRLADLELRILDFKPDAFFLICHNGEEKRNIRMLAGILTLGDYDLTYPYIKNLVQRAGIKPGDSTSSITRALYPFSAELHRWTYLRIIDVCEEAGITPVWIYVPITRSHKRESFVSKSKKLPVELGIHTIVLDNLFVGYEIEDIVISEADSHPNRLGHQLIARRLLEKIKADRKEIGLPEEIERAELPPLVPGFPEQ